MPDHRARQTSWRRRRSALARRGAAHGGAPPGAAM